VRLTKETEYAIVGLALLAEAGEGAVLPVSEIAESGNLPPRFLAGVFHRLARSGLVVARRGPGEGCRLARPAEEITLADVVRAVEGADALGQCLLWRGHCAEGEHCPLHPWLRRSVEAVRQALEDTSLSDFLARRNREEPEA